MEFASNYIYMHQLMQLMIMHFLYQHVFLHIMWIHGGGARGTTCSTNFKSKKITKPKTLNPKMSSRINKTTSLIPNLKHLNNSLKECDMSWVMSFPYSEGYQPYLPALVAFQGLWRQQTQSQHPRCWPCGKLQTCDTPRMGWSPK